MRVDKQLASCFTCLSVGSPVVPFTLCFGDGFPYNITNPNKGALIVIWLLGYQVAHVRDAS